LTVKSLYGPDSGLQRWIPRRSDVAADVGGVRMHMTPARATPEHTLNPFRDVPARALVFQEFDQFVRRGDVVAAHGRAQSGRRPDAQARHGPGFDVGHAVVFRRQQAREFWDTVTVTDAQQKADCFDRRPEHGYSSPMSRFVIRFSNFIAAQTKPA
jgi:hypothetical protein